MNRDDFVIDFDAYWRRDVTSDLPVRTWLRSEARSRTVAAWHGQNFHLVAETVTDCQRWMINRYGADEARKFEDAAAIWLDRLPEPEIYPDNAGVARRFISQWSRDGVAVFDRLMMSMTD